MSQCSSHLVSWKCSTPPFYSLWQGSVHNFFHELRYTICVCAGYICNPIIDETWKSLDFHTYYIHYCLYQLDVCNNWMQRRIRVKWLFTEQQRGITVYIPWWNGSGLTHIESDATDEMMIDETQALLFYYVLGIWMVLGDGVLNYNLLIRLHLDIRTQHSCQGMKILIIYS